MSFMDKALEKGETVYVHCQMGISRSATFVIAYLLKNLKMTSEQSYQMVKSKRLINPNRGFRKFLVEYESILNKNIVDDQVL